MVPDVKHAKSIQKLSPAPPRALDSPVAPLALYSIVFKRAYTGLCG